MYNALPQSILLQKNTKKIALKINKPFFSFGATLFKPNLFMKRTFSFVQPKLEDIGDTDGKGS